MTFPWTQSDFASVTPKIIDLGEGIKTRNFQSEKYFIKSEGIESGSKGDILFGLSTSGNSKNIINAFDICRNSGVHTVGFTGETGGLMKEKSDYLLNVPSIDTPRIQESHIMIGHIICELVEKKYLL
jgi:fructoselysine-6-P-deglycase FrlB-like protein